MRVARHNEITVIELGPSYESLDDDALEEIGGLLLTEATIADPPRVVLDLSHTSYIGSMFIELLIRAWKRLRERGGTLVLCGLQPFCDEVLRTARLNSLWQSCATQQEALEAVGRQMTA